MQMTWAEFKQAVEECGVRDVNLIAWIDVNGFDRAKDLAVKQTDDGLEIY